MARNGSGTMTVLNTATTLTPISSSEYNANMTDMASELTNSVAADGQTTITGALKGANGAVGTPSYSFASDLNTGMYRIGSDNLGLSAGGTKILDISTTGLAITGTLSISGAVTFSTGIGTTSIANDAITYAKIQNVSATNKLLGRSTSGAGDVEEIGLGVGVSFSGGNLVATAQLPRGYVDGCIMSNGTDATNDIDISAGVCRDSTNTVDITIAASTKQLDANWAAGTSGGMRNSAAGITDTTYWIYAVATAAGVSGIYAHTSATISTVLTALQAESGGTDYVYAQCLGGIVRSGATILAFTQLGDDFLWNVHVRDVNNSSTHTSAQTAALTVPIGRKVIASIIVTVAGTSADHGTLVTSLDQSDNAPSLGGTQGVTASVPTASARGSGSTTVRTNTSGQIRYRASDGGIDTIIITTGWRYERGRNA